MKKRAWVLGPGAVAAGGDIQGPVRINIVNGRFDGLREAIFDHSSLAMELDLEHFTGREWLIARIDRFIAAHDSGYVLVQAEAGVGKSTLAAHLVWTRPCAYHFTRLGGAARDPIQARRSLAAQLIGLWDLGDEVADGSGGFPYGSDRPDWLEKVISAAARRRDKLRPGAPLVLVVDGLDEAEDPGKGQDTGIPLGMPYPDKLPRNVFIVATTRLGVQIPRLSDRNAWHTIVVDGSDNLADMRRYLAVRVEKPRAQQGLAAVLKKHGVEPQWFADTLADRCGGVWIYMRYVLNDIVQGLRDPTDLESLPDGLIGYYLEQVKEWQSFASWPTAGRRVLAVLAALQRQVTLAELADICATDKEALRDWLNGRLRAFLDVIRGAQRSASYSIRHQSLRDLFASAEADDSAQWAATREELREAFSEAHTLITAFHRREADRWSRNTSAVPHARYEAVDHLFQARRHLCFAGPEERSTDESADIAGIAELILVDTAGQDEPGPLLMTTAALTRYLADTAEPSLWGFAAFVEEPSFYSGMQLISYLENVLDAENLAHAAAAKITGELSSTGDENEELIEQWFAGMRKAVRGRLAEAGPEHRDQSCLRLADLLAGSGELNEAERFYRESAAIRHRRAESNPGDRKSWLALGDCYDKLTNLLVQAAERSSPEPISEEFIPDVEKMTEAWQFCEKALEIRERVWGPSDQEVRDALTGLSSILGNLARLLWERWELPQARPVYQRIVQINERLLGRDDATTISSVNELAWLLHDQGKLAEARPLYERAVHVTEREMGPDHVDTGVFLNNLALLLYDQGELESASRLFERALEVSERNSGPVHLNTSITMRHLADLRLDQGRSADAESLHERALVVCERAQYPDDLNTALCLCALARLRLAQDKVAEAIKLYERGLSMLERTPGPDHWYTARGLHGLAWARLSQGDLTEAARLFGRSLEICERRLGPDHPYVADCLYGLGRVHCDLGDLTQARPLFERALQIRTRAPGPVHPATSAVRDTLGQITPGGC